MKKEIEINFYNMRDISEHFNHEIPFLCIDIKTFDKNGEMYIQLSGLEE